MTNDKTSSEVFPIVVFFLDHRVLGHDNGPRQQSV